MVERNGVAQKKKIDSGRACVLEASKRRERYCREKRRKQKRWCKGMGLGRLTGKKKKVERKAQKKG